MFRHAVDAAEIASISDRYAQIGDGALEWVDQSPRFLPGAINLNCRSGADHYCHPLPAARIPALTDLRYRNSARYWPASAIGASSRDLCRNVAPKFIGVRLADLWAKVMMAPERVRPSLVQGAEPPQPLVAELVSLRVSVDFFFAVDGAAGDNSTTTGLGRSLGGSPVDVIASSLSVSGW